MFHAQDTGTNLFDPDNLALRTFSPLPMSLCIHGEEFLNKLNH